MAQSCSNLSRASWISPVVREPGRVDLWGDGAWFFLCMDHINQQQLPLRAGQARTRSR